MIGLIRKLVDNPLFQNAIVGVILVNAVILGLMTNKSFSPSTHHMLEIIDQICLIIFCCEIALKLIAYRLDFFKNGWNIFDVLVVGIALMPASGELSVLRALRVLRLMRLASAVPSMRRVISGMFHAIPGSMSVAAVLGVMYYVAAIIGINLFRDSTPERFGDMGTTLFTLFQMMTLESWPDIAKDVLQEHPNAWIFFVLFILFTTFTTLNLLFGIIVNAMEEAKEENAREKLSEQGVEVSEETPEMRMVYIENEVKAIRSLLERVHGAEPHKVHETA